MALTRTCQRRTLHGLAVSFGSLFHRNRLRRSGAYTCADCHASATDRNASSTDRYLHRFAADANTAAVGDAYQHAIAYSNAHANA